MAAEATATMSTAAAAAAATTLVRTKETCNFTSSLPTEAQKALQRPKRRHQFSGTTITTNAAAAAAAIFRCLLLDLPLLLVTTTLAGLFLIQHAYLQYVTPLMESNRRGAFRGNFVPDYENEFTYYNRHCSAADISTASSNDLLIPPHYTAAQAANVMLEHGAVAFRNVLNDTTATKLRAYLASRNEIRDQLSYNEKFWSEMNRLSLGIGTNDPNHLGGDDDDIIQQAMHEVGTHPVLQRTLEGILGPDPTILEISTLTSLNGADDQGIHTDSDWFGSSLLYARTFLHSYSLFVALQDTSKALGATTICPGTHYCADPDLEDVCLDHDDDDDDSAGAGAFEVSTNGYTGDNGLLYKGDAFLFNQNVWHRGPKNVDPDGKDRIMFIMTFASRTKDTPGDRRRQGLGTYYYQRWNMWGHTFEDLKNAGSVMIQPWAALRALGLWKPAGTKWGVTWLEQFSQQIANGDEFYAEWELPVLKEEVFDYYNVPAYLQSQSEDWEEFIVEEMALWISFLVKIDLAVLAAYVVVSYIAHYLFERTVKEQKTRNRPFLPSLLRRMALIFGTVCLATYASLLLFERSVLAKAVKSGDIFVRPFPPVSDDDLEASLLPTTLPRTNDVLIGTRFDAEFLASYDRFLNFHPGNKRWNGMVARAAQYHGDLQGLAIKALVEKILEERDEEGVLPRFLLQDPFTGYWGIMPKLDALHETRRSVLMKQKPLLGYLARHLKHVLADARFGVTRDTVMSKKYIPLFVSKWDTLLLGPQEVAEEVGHKDTAEKAELNRIVLLQTSPLVNFTSKLSPKHGDRHRFGAQKAQTSFAVGHCVWVYEEDNKWYQAHIHFILENGMYEVKYAVGGYGEVHPEALRHCEPFKEGDRIEVDYYRNGEEYYPGIIAGVHPDGRYEVAYDDGELGSYVEESLLYPLFEEEAENL